MKKLLLVFITLATFLGTSAQVTWNIKGGVGVATCFGSDVEDLKPHFVGKIGGGLEKAFSPNWSLMPSLEIAWKGTQYSFEETEPYGNGKYKYSETLDILYLQIPVMAAYRLNLSDNWNMTIKAGPYFALGLWGNLKQKYEINFSGISDNANDNYNIFDEDANRFDVGFDIGVDFECRRFVFGLEYEIGFVSIIKEESIHNSAFYATVGWKF